MALTRDFAETVKELLQEDPAFRVALLKEAMDCLLVGEVSTGKALLRDYVNATVGFEKLAEMTKMPAKSLHRMLGPNGNPRAENLFRMLGALQKAERVEAKVELVGPSARERAEPLGVRESRVKYGRQASDADNETVSAARWAKLRAASHRRKK